MEVADRLAIINEGRIEQNGTPAEIYDRPRNEFVFRFLGSATQLDGTWVRPHDLVVHRDPALGGHAAVVERVIHLGFEVRVELHLSGGGSTWVQLSRGAATELDLVPGHQVWVAHAGLTARERPLHAISQ